uniref:Uncharacterized protein n=1 Tax=Panagrolaimus sp. JU765 TaxID=591449 RepID=A0AC34RKL8_9BILA
MTSEFVYGEKTKKLKVAGLTPKMLSFHFKIEEDSIILCDEDGESYLPDGNEFCPSLNVGMKYEVDGIDKQTKPKTETATTIDDVFIEETKENEPVNDDETDKETSSEKAEKVDDESDGNHRGKLLKDE